MAASSSLETKNRYAICVGINRYDAQDQILPLQFAEQDAKDVYVLLLAHGFDSEHSYLLLGESATWEAMHHALTTLLLTKARKDDLVIFYFAGHSIPISINDDDEDEEQEPQSDVFLCSTNFDLQKMVDERGAWLGYPLRMQKLRTDIFELAASRKVLFIFDSCHSGDFFGKHYRPRTSENLAMRYIEQPFGKNSRGRLVLSSCLPHQTSRESKQLEHGLFTYHLLEALTGRVEQAIRHDGWVTVGSLFDYLADQLPKNQRPVKSGVEHDTFRLLQYSMPADKSPQASPLILGDAQQKYYERNARLQALLADHSGLLRTRLESFVGREQELTEIRTLIAHMQPIGGYITITGQAGEGKSSIIAKLVQDYGFQQTSYHFIPFRPGPDHQVGLLRNLMARLILKYDLPELYIVSESRPALRDYFPHVLQEVAKKGGQEVIFIDGLDQLEEDSSGGRDLTFLPDSHGQPPPGIVFVLGTRPNDTLRPLELLKPHHEYRLPHLSREDFDRILFYRRVSLSTDITDQFYRVMQANALFLDLVAKELTIVKADTPPEEMIKRLANNPANLFSFAMERLERTPEWDIIEQVLGLLLASREPLSLPQLRQIIGVKEYRLRNAIARLGGLLTESMPKEHAEHRRYSLFHLMFQDFLGRLDREPERNSLFAPSDVEQYHHRLAQWCEGEQLSLIWQDTTEQTEQARRAYARQHYITHLYLAHEWQRLFSILDAGQYGQKKVRYDPSTRSYSEDLDLGRKAAGWDHWSFEKGVGLLPSLWCYTLLRCSLASRANRYPEASFRLLVFLERDQEAIGLAELLTNERWKVHVLIEIAHALEERQKGPKSQKQETKHINIFMRAHEVACIIKNSEMRAQSLYELRSALFRTQQWAEAERVICTIEDSEVRAIMLHELGIAMAQSKQWTEAERVVRTIEDRYIKARALTELGAVLAQAQQEEQAQAVWVEAERVIYLIEDCYGRKDNYAQDKGLYELGMAKAQTEQWIEANVIRTILDDAERIKYLQESVKASQWTEVERIFRTIEGDKERTRALMKLGDVSAENLSEQGVVLIRTQQAELARAVWAEAECLIRTVDSTIPDKVLCELGKRLILTKQWVEAERVIRAIDDSKVRTKALVDLGVILFQVHQDEQAQVVWAEIMASVHAIEDSEEHVETLVELGVILLQVHQDEQAQVVWAEIMEIVHTIQAGEEQAEVLMDLGVILLQVQQQKQAQTVWTEATGIICTIENSKARIRALVDLGVILIQAQQDEQAQIVWKSIVDIIHAIENNEARVQALVELGILIQAQQEEQKQNEWEVSWRVQHAIENNEARAQALVELGVILSLVQQKELVQVVLVEAERIIRAIEDNEARAEAFVELGVALAQAQQKEQAQAVWTEAADIIRAIKDGEERAQVFVEPRVARAQHKELARARWAEANRIIRTIEENYGLVKSWDEREMAKIHTQTEWAEAEQIIHAIEDNEERAKALVELGTALATANKWVQLLSLTQCSWQQADTKDYAIALLPLAYDLIALKPDIGIAFYDAFAWVDTFLKG